MEKEDRLLAQSRIVTFDGDRVRIVELSNPTDTSIISDLLILFFFFAVDIASFSHVAE